MDASSHVTVAVPGPREFRRPRAASAGWVAALAAVSLLVAAAGASAATGFALRAGTEINVSQSIPATDRARLARLAYVHAGRFVKAELVAYVDGPPGRQNVYVRSSFDGALTWSPPVLLSRDASGAPTGGQPIAVHSTLPFVADNGKPSLVAPPNTTGPRVLVAWSSGYCPAPGGAAGPAGQGVGDSDGDGVPDRPYHCLWAATSTDPALLHWEIAQQTHGERDVIGEVAAGSRGGSAFALTWQEDPAGLQPGDAEGPGDGGSGAHVSGGTNIWYAHASAADAHALRATVRQVSDNLALGAGRPGASRPSLSLVDDRAVLAYEESACAGGTGGKCIVLHAFDYRAPDELAAGAIVSDPRRHARRVRIVRQAATVAGASPLRCVLLWRDSASATAAAPADIMLRRGLADAAARLGSDGCGAADLMADTPQNMTRVAATGGDARAHRAQLRGSFIALAYTQTSDAAAARAPGPPPPSSNYNLFITRSNGAGAPGSWSAAADLSQLAAADGTVVEPRLVATAGTVINPLTGRPEPGDRQNPDVLFVAYATQTANPPEAGRIWVSRSTDLGRSFEPFRPVSAAATGQTQPQLRAAPDGESTAVLWIGQRTPGLIESSDATYAVMRASPLPDLALMDAGGEAFPIGAPRTMTLTVLNRGAGSATFVRLVAAMPPGLKVQGVANAAQCSATPSGIRCVLPSLAAGADWSTSITVSSDVVAKHVVAFTVSSDEPDAVPDDNRSDTVVDVTAASTLPPAPPPPLTDAGRGGGCSTAPQGAHDGAGADPTLWLLALFAGAAAWRRRRTFDGR